MTTKENEIYQSWQEGKTMHELVDIYGNSYLYIKKILIKYVGKEKYREIAKSRTGAGSLKRKAHPKYPDWMDK